MNKPTNDIYMTLVERNDGPMIALFQGPTVIYIPAGDAALQVAEGMVGVVERVNQIKEQQAQSQKPNIVKPPNDFDPKHRH